MLAADKGFQLLDKLEANHRRFFRDELRNARAATLRDSENFSEILFALERLGSFLYGPNGNLGRYESYLEAVAKRSQLYTLYGSKWGISFTNLFRMVREARNDSMHTGAFARHAASNSVLVSLMLEDALMSDADTLNEFMVTEPICAELWHPIGLVRQKMLANSFSFLPICFENSDAGWVLVSDSHLARYLRGVSNAERRRRLAQSVQEAVSTSKIILIPAKCYSSDTSVEQLKNELNQEPVLLFDGDDRTNLLGLVTAFDLL